MGMMPTFTEYYNVIKKVEKAIDNNDGTIEGVLENIEKEGLNVETVMTTDIATMTIPIGTLKRRHPDITEVAPDNPKAEEFITKNKSAFKKRYGDDWEKVLYSTAWKLFGDKKK